jgi:hypothetical protein
MYTVIKSLVTDFPNGLHASQLKNDINATITTTCGAVNIKKGVVSIIFVSQPSGGDLTTVDILVTQHTPEPKAFSQFKFETVTSAHKMRKKSILADTTSENFTITLPSVARTVGAYVGIKKTVAANTLTVAGANSDQVKDSASVDLTTINSYLFLCNNGTQWIGVNTDKPVDIAENEQLLVDTEVKGAMSIETGTGTEVLEIGTNGFVLTADSAEVSGMKWAAAGGVASADFQSQDVSTEYSTSSGSYVTASGSVFATSGSFTGQYIIKCYFELGESKKNKYVNAIVRRTDISEDLTGELKVGSNPINYTAQYVEKIITLSGETPTFDIRVKKGNATSVSIRNMRWVFYRMI